MKILVIDDEDAIRRLLRTAFGAKGMLVVEAATGREGLATAIAERPDFILLDLGLPDGDGRDVLRSLREWYERPVIVLSVRDQEDTIVSALDAGADDYLTKPFHMAELFARIRVAERHYAGDASEGTMCFGSVEWDRAARRITRHGVDVKLTVTEYDVFQALALHAGKVMTHRQLLREIWGPNASEHVQYLRVYVGHLRQKLEDDANNPQLIVTEPGVGYRLVP